MDPNLEIVKWIHLIFGFLLLSSNDIEDCFTENLKSIQHLTKNNS